MQSFKDLEGKKIAILALQAIPHLGILVAADFCGVDSKKLKLLEIPLPSMVAALKEGAVDVAHKDIQVQIDLCAKYGFIKNGFDAREIVADFIPLE